MKRKRVDFIPSGIDTFEENLEYIREMNMRKRGMTWEEINERKRQ